MINKSLFLIIQNYLKFLINTKNMMPNFNPLPEHALYDAIRFFYLAESVFCCSLPRSELAELSTLRALNSRPVRKL